MYAVYLKGEQGKHWAKNVVVNGLGKSATVRFTDATTGVEYTVPFRRIYAMRFRSDAKKGGKDHA